MSAAAVERLIGQSEKLIRALDGQDLAQLDAAQGSLIEVLTEIAAVGGWHATDDLRGRIVHALGLLDAARGRVNYLADHNRRRLDRLSALTGAPRTSPYGRHGRLS